jgi:hypothetical protein
MQRATPPHFVLINLSNGKKVQHIRIFIRINSPGFFDIGNIFNCPRGICSLISVVSVLAVGLNSFADNFFRRLDVHPNRPSIISRQRLLRNESRCCRIFYPPVRMFYKNIAQFFRYLTKSRLL